jgi:hypothetical protein
MIKEHDKKSPQDARRGAWKGFIPDGSCTLQAAAMSLGGAGKKPRNRRPVFHGRTHTAA